MDLKKKNMVDFLLTNDFSIYDGYSYQELVNFLCLYKSFYRELYDVKEYHRKEIIYIQSKENNDSETILRLRATIEMKDEIITKMYNKKLSLWERIIGKIKY